jgi:hypothetical protein
MIVILFGVALKNFQFRVIRKHGFRRLHAMKYAQKIIFNLRIFNQYSMTKFPNSDRSVVFENCDLEIH